MSNGLFLVGLSGLNAAQAALVTTGHNTANVNTPGYSRQTAQIQSAGGVNSSGVGFIGNGSRVSDVSRSYDVYLTTQLNQAQSVNQSLTSYSAQLGQVDNMLANATTGLAPQMQALFTSVQAVANTPADPAARQHLISSAQTMTTQFRSMNEYLHGLNENVNSEVAGAVLQINTFAEQIANINQQVVKLTGIAGGQAPNDLLDQRDQLVNDLSKLVATKVVAQDSGQYNVFIGNGQTLVLGDNARKLAAVSSPSNPSQTSIALLDSAGKSTPVQDSMLSGGSLGGLLQFRNEALGATQNALGRIAIVMSDTFNAQHALGVDLNSELGGEFFSQAAPSAIANSSNSGTLSLSPSFSNVKNLTTSDYRLDITAASGSVLTRLSDNKVIPTSKGFPGPPPANSVTFDGVTLRVNSGVAAAGDSFLIQPTRTGARDLSVLITDPAKVAVSAPIVTISTAGNQGKGDISAGTVDASYLASPLTSKVTLSYDSSTGKLSGFPAGFSVSATQENGTPVSGSPFAAGAPVTYQSGSTLSFGGVSLKINGALANHDTFSIASNSGGVSDGRNALLLGALQNQKTVGSGTSNFNESYSEMVSVVANKGRQLQISNTAQTSLTTQIRTAQQSISGVNQDEETANLLMFQQMYQANAKVIQTASTLFDAVLGIMH
jgi:flagellar hook-associated protein 1 FlgK